MIDIEQFNPELSELLPETYELLSRSHLVVDDRVYQIILHGSRGPKGGATEKSNLNVTLVVDDSGIDREDAEHEAVMKNVLETTIENWRGPVELDVCAVFDLWGCGLPCFSNAGRDPSRCRHKGIDCFGYYRKKGTNEGYVARCGSQVKKMRPCLTLWRSN